MKVSINWLKDYVAIGLPAEKLAHRLTMAGLEVEHAAAVGHDTVFEIEVTPNRVDCLNVLGIAREVSAILNKNLNPPKVRKIHYPSQKCDIEILDRDACPRYIGTVIRGVNVTPSPEWLAKRISSVGLRPINNIVDITNFSLLENGQPLHAFDYDKLNGGKVIVRRARQGETIVTIDGVERKLDPSVLVIADSKRPVAVAGVMGGKDTEVTSATQNILLESAYFEPVLIRRASRLLGLSTDSSYRFERGVDVHTVESGANRTVALIRELAGGQIESRTDLFPGKKGTARRQILISKNTIDSALGETVTLQLCKTILKRLGFDVEIENKTLIKAVPPTVRLDIKEGVDIIEEIARVIGYDNLSQSLPTVNMGKAMTSPQYLFKSRLREALTGLGLDEIITYTMTNRGALARAGQDGLEGIAMKNALTSEHDLLRPSLLPGALSVVRLNLNRGQRDLRLFEIGKVYGPDGEKEALSLILTGTRQDDWRAADREPVDIYDLKGIIERALGRFGLLEHIRFSSEDASDVFSSGEAVRVLWGTTPAGHLGKVRRDILQGWDIKHEPVLFAQILIEGLAARQPAVRPYEPLPEYPTVVRDVSLAVPQGVTFGQIKETVGALGQGYVADVKFLEQYLGEKIPAGQRGLVFSVVYRSFERTLTEQEVQAVHERICRAIQERFSAALR
ncbi:MAG: phenylalanine--tRNA ligase subunit beta [Candidatus Omnitrophota bacterium]|nr:phenylalanine--tRNA ligase subunit beta [Candidatus Omnitrophota bacterium]MDZ4242184.1 phenylalanine--tRNA ligase subunit beta [Candidatus Omnitrophota bacterium]